MRLNRNLGEPPSRYPPATSTSSSTSTTTAVGQTNGATGSIIVNGNKVAEGRIEKTLGALYSLAAEPADIGHDSYSPVTDDYDPWDNAFTGTINKVTVKHKEHQPA